MKIKYLGTAASEGWPAVFCNCASCNEAWKTGGKNIRTRSQMLINDDFLVDMPCDTYMHALTHGMRLDLVKYLLITHSHEDHFYLDDLNHRGWVFAHDMREPDLSVLSNESVAKKYTDFAANASPHIKNKIKWSVGVPYKTYTLGGYTIIPLPANHMKDEQAYIYVIQNDGKTMLYCNDTGFLFPEVFDFIERTGLRFDLISLDCTMVNNPVPDTGTHMGFDACSRVLARLRQKGALNKNCRTVATHFSHNGKLMHDALCHEGEKYGLEIAYDGFTLDI